MTANEIRYNILIGIDGMYENPSPGYNDTQISSIINRAQRRVFREYHKKFDSDEKTKRILSPLISGASYDNGDIVLTTDTDIVSYSHSTDLLSSIFLSLPSNTGFIIEESTTLYDGVNTLRSVLTLPIQYDYFMKNHNNRYKKPYNKLVWRMDSKIDTDSKPTVEIIYDDTYSVVDYVIRYLRYPNNIVVNTVTPINQVSCEITDSSFIDEIIGESIKIITASLNEEGYQVSTVEKKFDE